MRQRANGFTLSVRSKENIDRHREREHRTTLAQTASCFMSVMRKGWEGEGISQSVVPIPRREMYIIIDFGRRE